MHYIISIIEKTLFNDTINDEKDDDIIIYYEYTL